MVRQVAQAECRSDRAVTGVSGRCERYEGGLPRYHLYRDRRILVVVGHGVDRRERVGRDGVDEDYSECRDKGQRYRSSKLKQYIGASSRQTSCPSRATRYCPVPTTSTIA